MRWVCVALALCAAGPVQAKLVTVTMTGTLETKGPPQVDDEYGSTENTPLAIGDTITATLTFNDLVKFTEGSKTFYTPWPLAYYGGAINIGVGPFTWNHVDEIMSGEPGWQSEPVGGDPNELIDMPRPLLVFDNDAFQGFDYSLFDGTFDRPDITIEGFSFILDESAYVPYLGPSFTGSFDPASVQITGLASPAPEPSTWAFMLVGFGAVGGALRRASRPAKDRDFSRDSRHRV